MTTDPLADLVLRDICSYNTLEEFLGDLKRAKNNRVHTLAVIKAARHCRQRFEIPHATYEHYLSEWKEFEESAGSVLDELESKGIRFLVLKHAPYPHASYDIDIAFPDMNEFRRAIPILASSHKVRFDPHVSGVREFKALTIVLPVRMLFQRASGSLTIGRVKVPAPEPPLSAVIHALHAFKHRELYLGDLLSYHIYVSGMRKRELSEMLHIVATLRAEVPVGYLTAICIMELERRMETHNLFDAFAARQKGVMYPKPIPLDLIVLAALKVPDTILRALSCW